jgi:hypothetical protein
LFFFRAQQRDREMGKSFVSKIEKFMAVMKYFSCGALALPP